MLKIGVGPSSSHTLGPWKAAQAWNASLAENLTQVKRVRVELFGSLSLTGKGHATDIAVILGLLDADPVSFDTNSINETIEIIRTFKRLALSGSHNIDFDPDTDISFNNSFRAEHANAMSFKAYFLNGETSESFYYSLGGGFIADQTQINQENKDDDTLRALKYPINNASELLKHCKLENCSISDLVGENELNWRDKEIIDRDIDAIWRVMLQAMFDGCHTQGILPGGLEVKRRAFKTHQKLIKTTEEYTLDSWIPTIRSTEVKFREILKWVSCFALSVNEVNASLGRVVTAPTNGSAGVIPAVLMYYMVIENHQANFEHIKRFLFVAGEIGCIFKKNATISAAMGGCQAEIGVSSAMAAAGLCELLGGSPEQVTSAAEIAMEHHLGMTCDPIGGLVQVPCIERNSMGAIKAIHAAEIALENDEDQARVSLDEVISTMWKTAQDMHTNYKETAKGGLAIAVSQADC